MFLYFRYFLQNLFLLRCSNTRSQHLALLYFFWGIFWFRTFFFSSSYQKKVRAVGSFPQQNKSKLSNQTGRNHCDLFYILWFTDTHLYLKVHRQSGQTFQYNHIKWPILWTCIFLECLGPFLHTEYLPDIWFVTKYCLLPKYLHICIYIYIFLLRLFNLFG